MELLRQSKLLSTRDRWIQTQSEGVYIIIAIEYYSWGIVLFKLISESDYQELKVPLELSTKTCARKEHLLTNYTYYIPFNTSVHSAILLSLFSSKKVHVHTYNAEGSFSVCVHRLYGFQCLVDEGSVRVPFMCFSWTYFLSVSGDREVSVFVLVVTFRQKRGESVPLIGWYAFSKAVFYYWQYGI